MLKRTKIIIIISLAALALIGGFWLYLSRPVQPADQSNLSQPDSADFSLAANQDQVVANDNVSNTSIQPEVPLPQWIERIKKPFGIKVSPSDSPISPERFSGYHTGTDFEILPGEENQAVEVLAICDGPVKVSRKVSGYGGVIVQSCNIAGQTAQVLYGHLAINDPSAVPAGKDLAKGEVVAKLASANSEYSGDERKHLHLGLIKGEIINYRGYVSSPGELSAWIAFEDYF